MSSRRFAASTRPILSRQRAGAEQLVFIYCSTFDSTDRGNIGPVAEALMDLTGADFTVACPAFPANARSTFKGYLFVGDALLNESAMRDHPLTPMRRPRNRCCTLSCTSNAPIVAPSFTCIRLTRSR